MDANSLSSGSKSGSSALSSGSSAASRAATSASASLSSAAAKASASAAAALGNNKAPKGSFISPITLSVLAIVLAGAYYGGYLDGLIAYVQSLLSQANDQKEQVMKENTGHISVREAAKEQYNRTAEKGNNMMDQNSGDIKRSVRQEADNASNMLSSQTH